MSKQQISNSDASPGESHSVTRLIEQLQRGESADHQRAAQQLWERYSSRLLDLARRQLSAGIRRREDEEDVVQSMYKSFCRRGGEGRFELGDRSDLWKLLVRMTENKAKHAAARHQRGRRDHRREKQEAATTDGDATTSPVDLAPGLEPTPDDAAALVEGAQRLLDLLDEPLRQVALWKLAGFTNEEIAAKDKMDCTVRTVERKLAMIRERWAPAGG
jgi:RNA polymerase sigma factor (sigma-70 family)